MKHITTEQIKSLEDGRLTAADRVQIKQHIVNCSECRSAHSSVLEAIMSRPLSADPGLGGDGHLDHHELIAYVNGTLNATDRENADKHIGVCGLCRESVQSLELLQSELSMHPETGYAPEPKEGLWERLKRSFAPSATNMRLAGSFGAAAVVAVFMSVPLACLVYNRH